MEKFPSNLPNIWFLIDEELRIVTYEPSLSPYGDNTHLTAFHVLLKKGDLLSSYFKIPRIKPVVKSGSMGESYPIRAKLQNKLMDFYFFTSLPSYFCRIFRENNNSLYAAIYYSACLPRNDHFEDPIIFFDRFEILKAFNIPFYNLIREKFPSPFNLLNTPLRQILRQTPDSLSRLHISELQRDLQDGSWNNMNGVNSPDSYLVSDKSCCRTESDATVHVFNRTQQYHLLTYVKELDTNAYSIDIDYTSSSGRPPILMVGLKGFSNVNLLTPDQAGYSIGFSADGSALQFKKKGYLVRAWSIKEKFCSGIKYKLCVIIGENFFIYSIDGNCIAEHFNFALFSSYRKFLNIATPPCETMTMNDIILKKKDMNVPVAERDLENETIRINGTNRHYTLSFVANPFLKKSSRWICGLVLHEVTVLAKKIAAEHEAYTKLEKEINTLAYPDDRSFYSANAYMQTLLTRVKTASGTGMPVLIEGATGTGKEHLARFIHSRSTRSSGNFVVLDCSIIPQQLFESAVFGHMKGAFSGAVSDQAGILDRANGGTLFLDGIEEMPLSSQVKLLNVVESGKMVPVGGSREIRLDVRIIVSCKNDPLLLVKKQLLREDLFHRINTFHFRLPALKERKEDIRFLARMFLAQFNAQFDKAIKELGNDEVSCLEQYEWPGNIRELKNLIFQVCSFAEAGFVPPGSINEALTGRVLSKKSEKNPVQYLGRISRQQFIELLAETKGSITACAKKLQVERSTVYYNIRKYGVSINSFRQGTGDK